jgi:spoIIIJ-associated protein
MTADFLGRDRMERTTLEVIAPSVDEAVNQGLTQLGLPREAVDVEVLDSGSHGFLGIGSRQVRVRLTVKGSQSGAPEPDPAYSESSTSRKVDSSQAIDEDQLIGYIRETVENLVTKMKVDARVTAHYGEPDEDGDAPVLVDIRGDDLSVLIGRRSETLNALQYISGLIVSKEAGRYVQLVVDVEGYRNRRERQLRQLARRMAEQAIRSRRRQVLEPMSASDRRIIHLELRTNPEVETVSIGDEPNRKVTIVPK